MKKQQSEQCSSSRIDLGPTLRRHRRSRGLSLAEVAGAIGVTVGSLSRIETGLNTPTLQTLAGICDVIGVPIGDIFNPRPLAAPWHSPSSAKGGFLPSMPLRLVSHPYQSGVSILQGRLAAGESMAIPGPIAGGLLAVTIVTGSSTVKVGDAVFELRRGDTLSVTIEGVALWGNSGNEDTAALWVYATA